MSEVLAQLDRDAQLWAEWVNGSTQAEIAQRHGLAQQTVSDAVNRYSASIPDQDKRTYRERALSRLEGLYADHRPRARTSTRSAAICRQTIMDQARLLGLVTSKVEHSGQLDHEHYTRPEPSITMAELLREWRAEGFIKSTPALTAELERLDQ
jgi:hypothetical protein